MKRVYIISVITTLIAVIVGVFIQKQFNNDYTEKHINIGFIYVGDCSNAYTDNFVTAQEIIESTYGEYVNIIPFYNIAEDKVDNALNRLIAADCDIIFGTSYGYQWALKEAAEAHPEIQFCMATGDNANEEPKLSNYHTYMGRIYEGRYVSGIVAGMKLAEMIDSGEIKACDAKIGYVGAYPYAEVISGFTAFYLGVASIVPEVKMEVKYSNSWGDYAIEKNIAQELIDRGCVVISQHSDTYGPAVACEEAQMPYKIYHIGYNKNMADLAPTSSLISSKINWIPYEVAAVHAVLTGKPIEEKQKADVNHNDVCGGFAEDWVRITQLNDTIAAAGTQKAIDDAIEQFKNRKLDVFIGNYIGVNPFDESDVIDLKDGYIENQERSAPSFHYILKDYITILE